MTPKQLDDLDGRWRAMRKKKLSEVIEMKLEVDQFPTDKLLAEMELERRKFVRDVMIDRFLSGASMLIALVALVLSLWPILFPKLPTESSASPSTHISVQTNLPTSIPQFENTNKQILTNALIQP